MKRYINIFAAIAVALIFAACSKEDPFPGPDGQSDFGQLLKTSLAPALENAEGLAAFSRPGTRAEAPSADQFTVDFIRNGEETPYISYLFGDMPEVVTLPVGDYTAVAYYGENNNAAWEEPYFKGETSFSIAKDKITEVEQPIVAKLANVRVSISFGATLMAEMSDDSKVTVKVGEVGSIDFTKADAQAGKSAYFAYVEGSNSLTATFSGTVQGYPATESKGYDDVKPGSHYAITFRLHDTGVDETGTVSGSFTVDASVEIVDLNRVVDGEDDEIIEDDLRPVEGKDEEDPDQGGNGGDDPVVNPTPSILPSAAPDGMYSVKFDEWNDIVYENFEVTTPLYAAFNISSTAEGGFQNVSVKIISEKLNKDELKKLELTDEFDLADSKDSVYWASLAGLGFPTDIKGQSYAEFNITTFLGLMGVLGTPEEHKFEVTVTDANGSTTKTLMLRFL